MNKNKVISILLLIFIIVLALGIGIFFSSKSIVKNSYIEEMTVSKINNGEPDFNVLFTQMNNIYLFMYLFCYNDDPNNENLYSKFKLTSPRTTSRTPRCLNQDNSRNTNWADSLIRNSLLGNIYEIQNCNYVDINKCLSNDFYYIFDNDYTTIRYNIKTGNLLKDYLKRIYSALEKHSTIQLASDFITPDYSSTNNITFSNDDEIIKLIEFVFVYTFVPTTLYNVYLMSYNELIVQFSGVIDNFEDYKNFQQLFISAQQMNIFNANLSNINRDVIDANATVMRRIIFIKGQSNDINFIIGYIKNILYIFDNRMLTDVLETSYINFYKALLYFMTKFNLVNNNIISKFNSIDINNYLTKPVFDCTNKIFPPIYDISLVTNLHNATPNAYSYDGSKEIIPVNTGYLVLLQKQGEQLEKLGNQTELLLDISAGVYGKLAQLIKNRNDLLEAVRIAIASARELVDGSGVKISFMTKYNEIIEHHDIVNRLDTINASTYTSSAKSIHDARMINYDLINGLVQPLKSTFNTKISTYKSNLDSIQGYIESIGTICSNANRDISDYKTTISTKKTEALGYKNTFDEQWGLLQLLTDTINNGEAAQGLSRMKNAYDKLILIDSNTIKTNAVNKHSNTYTNDIKGTETLMNSLITNMTIMDHNEATLYNSRPWSYNGENGYEIVSSVHAETILKGDTSMKIQTVTHKSVCNSYLSATEHDIWDNYLKLRQRGKYLIQINNIRLDPSNGRMNGDSYPGIQFWVYVKLKLLGDEIPENKYVSTDIYNSNSNEDNSNKIGASFFNNNNNKIAQLFQQFDDNVGAYDRTYGITYILNVDDDILNKPIDFSIWYSPGNKSGKQVLGFRMRTPDLKITYYS